MKKKLEQIIVDEVLKELLGRKGFDCLWHEIDMTTKKELKAKLREKVLNLLDKHCTPD